MIDFFEEHTGDRVKMEISEDDHVEVINLATQDSSENSTFGELEEGQNSEAISVQGELDN